MSVKKILVSALAHLMTSAIPSFNPIDWRESYPIPRVRSRGTCRRSRVSLKIRNGRRG